MRSLFLPVSRHTLLPAAGKQIPTELREDYDDLQNEIDLEDEETVLLRARSRAHVSVGVCAVDGPNV